MLLEQKNFAEIDFKSWHYNTEVALTFIYKFSGLRNNKYKIVTTVKDKVSGDKVEVETWFRGKLP